MTLHADRMPWDVNVVLPFEQDEWELYNVEDDFSESRNLADEEPEKLAELIAMFDEEAWKYATKRGSPSRRTSSSSDLRNSRIGSSAIRLSTSTTRRAPFVSPRKHRLRSRIARIRSIRRLI